MYPTEVVCEKCGDTAQVTVWVPIYDRAKAAADDDDSIRPIGFNCTIKCPNCGKQLQAVRLSPK